MKTEKNVWINVAGKNYGPYSTVEIDEGLRIGKFQGEFFWIEGTTDWKPMAEWKSVPPPPAVPPPLPRAVKRTNHTGALKAVAVLALIFLVIFAVAKMGSDKEERSARVAAQEHQEDEQLAAVHKVRVGMSAALCRKAWGEPLRVSSHTDTHRDYEKWNYRGGNNLLFSNGVLKIIETTNSSPTE
jgi:hypothetical protein